MRKLVLVFSILLSNLSFSQGCELSFEELTNSVDYNLSKFDTFVIKKGFIHNSQTEQYLCEEDKKSESQRFLLRAEQNGITAVIYCFHDEKIYLKFKNILDAQIFLGTQNIKESLKLNYNYNGNLISLQTSTYVDGSNTYLISVSNRKI